MCSEKRSQIPPSSRGEERTEEAQGLGLVDARGHSLRCRKYTPYSFLLMSIYTKQLQHIKFTFLEAP